MSGQDLTEIVAIEPVHVAAPVEAMGSSIARSSVRQYRAVPRMAFAWGVVGQVLAPNPAWPARVTKYLVREGTTVVLSAEKAQTLLRSTAVDTLPGSATGR